MSDVTKQRERTDAAGRRLIEMMDRASFDDFAEVLDGGLVARLPVTQR